MKLRQFVVGLNLIGLPIGMFAQEVIFKWSLEPIIVTTLFMFIFWIGVNIFWESFEK